MHKVIGRLAALLLLAAGASLAAKGATARITITGPGLGAPIELTDAATLQPFQVWAGQGVSRTQGGVTTEETEGFIIDWAAGPLSEAPRGLPTYQVSFHVADKVSPATKPEMLAYVVLYAIDEAAGRDYVYLPGKGDQWYGLNVSHMSHGNEGHWFRASTAWQRTARPRIDLALHR